MKFLMPVWLFSVMPASLVQVADAVVFCIEQGSACTYAGESMVNLFISIALLCPGDFRRFATFSFAYAGSVHRLSRLRIEQVIR